MAGYALLTPAFLVMAVMMVAPLLALVALSFWSQNGFALIIGAFIQGVEAGTHQTMRMPGLAIVTISDIKRRFAIARGVPLSHRIIYLPADDAAK